MSTQNKLVKTLMEASTLVTISAGAGFIGRKIIKEPLTSDPSANIMNFGKWILVLTGSIYLREYLELNKIIPS